MHNTFFVCMIAFFLCSSAHAQFFTITRGNKKQVKFNVEQLQDTVIQELNQVDSFKNETVEPDLPELEESRLKYALARKRNVRNTRRRRANRRIEKSCSQLVGLPELTIPNLIREIRLNRIRHEEIVLAQAILETGWFSSSVCRNKHNLFGLTNPRTGEYYEFNHWTESVAAYYSKVQYRYKGGNYLRWLDKIGYAEADNYISALIRVIKQLRKHNNIIT